MSFKIVQQTKYVGINNPVAVKELTVVPEKWSRDNLLFWPTNLKRSKLEQLKNNPYSKPSENWSIQECILKRWNISSVDEANKILSDMESKYLSIACWVALQIVNNFNVNYIMIDYNLI